MSAIVQLSPLWSALISIVHFHSRLAGPKYFMVNPLWEWENQGGLHESFGATLALSPFCLHWLSINCQIALDQMTLVQKP